MYETPSRPPQTSHELNGWGDNVVHGYLRGVERNGRLGVVYANQDFGCEWDYDWKNKRFDIVPGDEAEFIPLPE